MSKESLHSINFRANEAQPATSGIKSSLSNYISAVTAFARKAIAETKASATDIFSLVAGGENAAMRKGEFSQGKQKNSQGKSKTSQGKFETSGRKIFTPPAKAKPSGKRVILFNENHEDTSSLTSVSHTLGGISAAAPATTASLTFGKASTQRQEATGTQLLARIERTDAIVWLASRFSDIFEEEVTTRRALRLLHAHIAVIFLILPIEMSFSMRALFLVWAIAATIQCRH